MCKENKLCSAGCKCSHFPNIFSTSTSQTAHITTELPLNNWDGLDDDLDDIMINVFMRKNSTSQTNTQK